MSISCHQFNVPDNTEDEISTISAAISATTAASGVDKRFILAIIMQESGGCVRAPTNPGGAVPNPGLMQDIMELHLATPAAWSRVPCSSGKIAEMVSEGTAGKSAGDGLSNRINEAATLGGSGATAYYWASRIYNTGSYAVGADLGAPLYASDVANRLMGWAEAKHPAGFKTSL